MEELIKDYQDITLTESDVLEGAKNAIRTISDSLQKSKAYYNVLAVSSVMKYLEEKGLIRGEIVNIHNSSKMLVEFEVADIQLSNLYIDVRAVFDENMIFIPKKHFEHKLLPDIYLIVKFDEDLMNGTLLGFVEPSQINKQNQNDEYYFVNYSALTSPSKLADLIKSRPAKTPYVISEAGEDAIEKLIMLFMDNDIDNLKLQKLLDYLKNSAIAREKLVEFENFERLSYMALKEFKDLDIENNDFTKYIKTLVATDEFSQFEDKEDDLSNLFDADTSAKAGGLFVDDDIIETANSEETPVAVEEEVVEEEDLPLEKGVTDAIKVEEEVEVSEEPTEEIVEGESEELELEEVQDLEEETVVDSVVAEAPVVEELPIADEFDAFEEKDEFDEVDEFSTSETVTEEIVEEDVSIGEVTEPVLEEEISETVLEPEEVLNEAQIEEPVLDLEQPLELEENALETEDTVSLEVAEIEETTVEPENVAGDEPQALEPEALELGSLEGLEDLSLEETSLEEDALVVEPEVDETAQIEETSIIEEAPIVEETPVVEEVISEPVTETSEEETSVITDEDIANVSPSLDEPLASEDLEFHVEGLEGLGEEFAVEGEELVLPEENMGEVSLETDEVVSEEIITELEPKKEDNQELEVAEALSLDEVNLDGETVIGLTEEVMDVDNIEEVNTSEEAVIPEELTVTEEVLENNEDLTFEGLEELNLEEQAVEDAPVETKTEQETELTSELEMDLDLASDESEIELDLGLELESELETEFEPKSEEVATTQVEETQDDDEITIAFEDEFSDDVLAEQEVKEQTTEVTPALASEIDFVETVSNEDIERAIAQSQEPVDEKKVADSVDLNDLDSLISDATASDDEMSLEELLSIENDLSSNEEQTQGGGRGFRFDDEDEVVPQENKAPAIAASAEELAMLSSSLEEDEVPVISDKTPQVNEVEEEGGTDFAFAVDNKPQGGKNMLIPAVALVAVLGIAGAGAWFLFSHKSTSNTVDISATGGGGGGFDMNDLAADIDTTPKSVDTQAAPNVPAQTTQTAQTTQIPPITDIQVPPAPVDENIASAEVVTMQKIKKDFSKPNSYLSVEKIVWDIPEYLTYNDDFNGYLQTLGSTIKRNVSTDLLLVNENPIYDRVKVRIQLKDSGKKYSAEISDGCGTKEIDDLVLQSVKSTLNLLQPPVNSLDTADEDLYLTLHL